MALRTDLAIEKSDTKKNYQEEIIKRENIVITRHKKEREKYVTIEFESLFHITDYKDLEEEITMARRQFEKIYYKEEPKVLPEVLTALKEADLIIFSMGSLYTSVLPNVMCKEVKAVLKEAKAPIMYLCNVVTQPGETDDFTVSDHVKLLNRYLDKKKVDAVIASNTKLDKEIAKKYETEEQKEPVIIDYEELEKVGVELIEDDLIIVEDNILRHNSLKLSSLIFSYLMRD